MIDTLRLGTFHRPDWWIKNDTLVVKEKLTGQSVVKDMKTKGIQLKEVQIKGWKSPGKELDHQYTSGAFFRNRRCMPLILRKDNNYLDLGELFAGTPARI